MTPRAQPKARPGREPNWFIWLTRHRLAQFGLFWILPFTILIGSLCSQFLNDQNFTEIFPSELVFPALTHGITALIIATAVYFLPKTRDIGIKAVAASLLGLLMINYDSRLQDIEGLYRAIMPIEPGPSLEKQIISLLFMLTLWGIIIAGSLTLKRAQRRFSVLRSANLIAAIVIFAATTSLVQAGRTASMLPEIASQSTTTAPQLPGPATPIDPAQPKPDIYYIVLDRYTNNQVLLDQFGHDNKSFTNSLESSGFHVRNEAFSNYPFTAISVASTLSGDYVDKLVAPYKTSPVQSRTLFHNVIQTSPIIKSLKSNGYTYHQIGNYYGSSNRAPLADTIHVASHRITLFGHDIKYLRDIEVWQFLQTPYYRFLTTQGISWWPLRIHEMDGAATIRKQLDTLNTLAASPNQGGRFILAHMLIPHDPYIFNADGSLSDNSDSDNKGKPIKQKYTGQVEFINGQMTSLIAKIKSQSNNQAVILLSPDEGAYPNVLNTTGLRPDVGVSGAESGTIEGDMRAWPDSWLRMKYGVMQAVYIPKASPGDLDHLSNVNLFRIILNRYFGHTLEYLPECHYALTKSNRKMYYYADITDRIRNTTSQWCRDRESQ